MKQLLIWIIVSGILTIIMYDYLYNKKDNDDNDIEEL